MADVLSDAGEHLDDTFNPPLRFMPIDAAAKTGDNVMLKTGPQYAVAYWAADMWAYRGTMEQVDFEPKHYARRN